MHSIQTYVLRLLVDPAAPAQLRGAIEPVPGAGARPHPFVGEQGLLALLHELTVAEGQSGNHGEPPTCAGEAEES